MWFKSGGAIEFGQALIRAGKLGDEIISKKSLHYRSTCTSSFTSRHCIITLLGSL